MTLGERVRTLREERGLTQRDLARPGLTAAFISRVEKGDRQPSERALRLLADGLGVTPLQLAEPNADVCPHCGRVVAAPRLRMRRPAPPPRPVRT